MKFFYKLIHVPEDLKYRIKDGLVDVFWASFWLGGLLYSSHVVREDFEEYIRFPSTVSQRESTVSEEAITFPTITVCMHSQHSKERLGTNYPLITDQLLQQFYGSSTDEINFSDEVNWRFLNQIDIANFFSETMPKYNITSCLIQNEDCTKNWTVVQTFTGYCMQLDSSSFFAANGGPTSRSMLRFSFQTHRNDSTFGWNGKISGMSVYYSQYLDSRITIDKSLLLTSDLIPIVRFLNEKRTFLGSPYQPCTPSNVTNNYPTIEPEDKNFKKQLIQMRPDYDEYTCVFSLFMADLCNRCKCFPSYIDTKSLYKTEASVCESVKKCTFFQHMICAANMTLDYQWAPNPLCKPACTKYSFSQESIQYADVNQKDSENTASIIIRLSRVQTLVHEEKSTYPLSQFVSDMGGAAGLILGLNVFVLVQFICKWSSYVVNASCVKLRRYYYESDIYLYHQRSRGNSIFAVQSAKPRSPVVNAEC